MQQRYINCLLFGKLVIWLIGYLVKVGCQMSGVRCSMSGVIPQLIISLTHPLPLIQKEPYKTYKISDLRFQILWNSSAYHLSNLLLETCYLILFHQFINLFLNHIRHIRTFKIFDFTFCTMSDIHFINLSIISYPLSFIPQFINSSTPHFIIYQQVAPTALNCIILLFSYQQVAPTALFFLSFILNLLFLIHQFTNSSFLTPHSSFHHLPTGRT